MRENSVPLDQLLPLSQIGHDEDVIDLMNQVDEGLALCFGFASELLSVSWGEVHVELRLVERSAATRTGVVLDQVGLVLGSVEDFEEEELGLRGVFAEIEG